MQLRIDNSAMNAYAKKLKQLHKSALPVVVRQTLNSAAFNVKQETMPKSAEKEFVHRKPNFFKANSRVAPAKGLDIKGMKATVGFVPKAKGGLDQAVAELKQQEDGGVIGNRSFISTPEARGGNWHNNVLKSNRSAVLAKKRLINANNVKKGASQKQKFIRAAFMARKKSPKNAFVLGNVYNGNQTLSRVNNIIKSADNQGIKVYRTPIYTYRKNRKVKIAGTNFMKLASKESGMKMEDIFIGHARKQFEKYMRR